MTASKPVATKTRRAGSFYHLLRCPGCSAQLHSGPDTLICVVCTRCYPVVDGVPILINEKVSTFRIADYVGRSSSRPTSYSRLKQWGKRDLPEISLNVAAKQNYQILHDQLLRQSSEPTVLVIGGASMGYGMEDLVKDTRIHLVETDVVLGERTKLVCDAHTLPFPAESFDGVTIQAVLEYIQDPALCAREIHRVLKPSGIVYSEAPFMQQVHGGCHDFMRFTHLGHRRLFRQFTEIASGSCGGPGTVLAWAIRQFFMSMTPAGWPHDAVRGLSKMFLFPLKYFDYVAAHSRGGIDGASGTYFLGTKSEETIDDNQLIRLYRGAVSNQTENS